MCQYELLVNTVPNICKDVAIIEAFKNLIDKLPLIYNNICRKMGGNNLVKSKRVKKACAERGEDKRIQNGVRLFSSSSQTYDEIIDKYQEMDYNQVV